MTSAVLTTPKRRKRRPAPVGMLRRADAAAFVGVAVPTFDRLISAGMTPQPIRLGGCLCFGKRELTKWIDFGCPPRGEWSPIWNQLKSRLN